jgi:transposase-like protein
VGISAVHCRAITAVSELSIGEWYEKVRKALASEEFFSHRKFGGIGKVIEIDDAVFARRKYQKGRKKKLVWLLGIAERASSKSEKCKIIVEVVKNRKKETLIPLITSHCLPCSTIHTDEFASYRSLATLEDFYYTHVTVCHKREFKNLETGGCTNTIEGMWHHVRGWMPPGGVRRNYLNDYLWSFLWKHNRENTFVNMLNAISSFDQERYNDFVEMTEKPCDFEEDVKLEGEIEEETPAASGEIEGFDEDDAEDYFLFIQALKGDI